MFKVGDIVAFKNRCQKYPCGMKVQEVHEDLFGTRLKVDYQWWSPACFISYDEWKIRAEK